MKKCKLLLFDLDGTLLQSDKTISTRTLSALKKCRGNDILIGVSTSRSEQNSLVFLNELMPDILISSGGALVKYKTEYIYRAEFSEEETNVMIDMARNICGNDCEITIDTIDAHYWNYKIDPKKLDKSWGDSIYTDFSDFNECSLKMCVEIFNQDKADKLARSLSDCDCIRFSDGFWYKFTKKNVTKENAIMKITEVCGFSTDSIIAFGDDYADIGMLELCGTGVAMGNAIDEVKERADIVIGSNDEEGIADFIENEILYQISAKYKYNGDESSAFKYIEPIYRKLKEYTDMEIQENIKDYEFYMTFAASILGSLGEYEESNIISNKIIRAQLQYGRIGEIHYNLFNIAWNKNEVSHNKKAYIDSLYQCMLCSQMCNDGYFENRYGARMTYFLTG